MLNVTRFEHSKFIRFLVFFFFAEWFTGSVAGAGQAGGSPKPPPGRPLAWIRFEKAPEKYGETPYWWLGKYELSFKIGVKPASGHALDLLWGSKGDMRGAAVNVNGESAKIEYGGYEGFRWVRLRLPGDLTGKRYAVTLSRAGGHEAFLAALRLTDTSGERSEAGKLEEVSHRVKIKTAERKGSTSGRGGLYAPAHPEILKIWQGVPCFSAPSAEKVSSGSSFAVFRWPAETGTGEVGRSSFRQAATSARIAGYSLSRVHQWLHEKALKHIEKETGLYKVRGKWDYRDTAADCYPFFTWAAWATDREVLNGPIRSILHTEQKLCNTLDRIPSPYDFRNGRARGGDYNRLVYGASEYVKDGLIPIVEVTGKDEWYERMKGIEEDIWKHAPVETPFGNIPSKNVEVNGEQLQVLPRLYRMSGEEKFLHWAERIADYYLSKDRFVPHRLDDHGDEIIGGLGLLLGVLSEVNPEKAEEYRAGIKYMLDQIIEQGTNEDGLFYNTLGGTGALSDNWGYDYVAHLCYDMASDKPVYRSHVERTLRNLGKPKYQNYPWEGGRHPDGYGDSIEGGIYVVNRLPVSEAREWIDRETMKNLIPPAPNTLGGNELWGLMKLHANGVRTVIMHALMHTQGCLALPWQQELELGGCRLGNSLAVILKSEKDWSGRLLLDVPRHRVYIGLERDWPRINTIPEWFTVDPGKSYFVKDPKKGTKTVMTGKELHEGKDVHLEAGEELCLIVTPRE